jgi:hypothetical protein
MMFADLVDLEDLVAFLSELGIALTSDATPDEIEQAVNEWRVAAAPAECQQLLEQLSEFQQASAGLILPAADTLLKSLLTELK